MAKLVSTAYGDALFELALEEGNLRERRKETEILRDVLIDNQEILEILNHPVIDKNSKIKLIENVFGTRCSDCIIRFLILVIEKGRQDEIIRILDYFIKKVKETEGIGTGRVTSAVALTDEAKAKIEEILLKLTDYKSMEIIYVVDETLIGGLVIHLDDKMIDSSIRTKLDVMKNRLIENPSV